MLVLFQEGEEVSLEHTYRAVPSGYPQAKHLSDKEKYQDEQVAPGQKEISSHPHSWLML